MINKIKKIDTKYFEIMKSGGKPVGGDALQRKVVTKTCVYKERWL